jgi:hypothetical protein
MTTLDNNFTFERYGLHVRFVEESDAKFIMELRINPDLSKYIHETTPDVELQRTWIRNYLKRQNNGEDFYFMFEKPKGTKLGICRIYDVKEDSFTIGSWIFSRQAPIGSSILADIITREIAYKLFPLKQHLFDVKRRNITVNRYHETYKSELLYQDEETNYYTCSKKNFEKYKGIHIRMFYNIKNYDK